MNFRHISILALILVEFCSGEVRYVPSDPKPLLVKRERLPLDMETISALAGHLLVLGDGELGETPQEMRHRVQILTLSERLSPDQEGLAPVLQALENGEGRESIDLAKQAHAKKEVLKIAMLLAPHPKHTEGSHLAQLLFDVLKPFGLSEAASRLHQEKNRTSRWAAIMPDLSAYSVIEEVPAEIIAPSPMPQPSPPEVETPSPEAPKVEAYGLTSLLTKIPLVTKEKGENKKDTYSLVLTTLTISPKSNGWGELKLLPKAEFDSNRVIERVKAFFEREGTPLPAKYTLNLNTNNRHCQNESSQDLAAPLAMMIDSALTRRQLRKDVILFADLNEQGSLIKPKKSWNHFLEMLGQEQPAKTRLILAPGALEELTGLLVLDQASFFITYEVIEAETFDEARELFYEDGSPSESLVNAITGYTPVREKAREANILNTFLSLAVVENRLLAVRRQSAKHLSAAMLATQSVRRPAYFTKEMFARELDRRLEKISELKYVHKETTARGIKDALKESRAYLNELSRRLQRNETLVLNDALDVLKELNSLGRSSSDVDGGEDFRKKGLESFHKNLKTFREGLRVVYESKNK